MRTLLISELFPPRVGGSATWFYQVYRHYPPGEAVVLTDYQPGDETVDKGLSLSIYRVPMQMRDWGFLNLRSARQYLRLALTATRLAREHGSQMIHCGRAITEGVIGYLLLRLTRLPYCVYAHGEEIGGACSSRQLTLLMRCAYRFAHRIVANSNNTRGLLRALGVPDRKIILIHPGVDVDRFRPCDDVSRTRTRLGLDGARVLLSVGRLQRRKGHDMVLRSLPTIAAVLPDIRYVIVGTGEEEARLHHLAQELNTAHRVEFRTAVSDEELPNYYGACDLFVMPNREEPDHDIEGFGIVFLEANACGKVVIGGKSGGTADAIVNGETGLRVDGESPQAIAEAVIDLLRNPERAASMGRKGRDRVVQHFNWDRIAAQTQRLT